MKEVFRQKAVKKRKNLDIAAISKAICQNISSMPVFLNAKAVGIFYPKNIEINLLPLCNSEEKTFYLPRVEENSMNFYKFNGKNSLKKGCFGILEPNFDCEKGYPELIIAPALCADKKGIRLGWGKGFYDKYLKNYNGYLICPVPDCLIFESLPAENHDVTCNFVVSEKRIMTIS